MTFKLKIKNVYFLPTKELYKYFQRQINLIKVGRMSRLIQNPTQKLKKNICSLKV